MDSTLQEWIECIHLSRKVGRLVKHPNINDYVLLSALIRLLANYLVPLC